MTNEPAMRRGRVITTEATGTTEDSELLQRRTRRSSMPIRGGCCGSWTGEA